MRELSSLTSDSPISLQCLRHGYYGDQERESHQNSAHKKFWLLYIGFFSYKSINRVKVGGWPFCRLIINNHLPTLASSYSKIVREEGEVEEERVGKEYLFPAPS